MLTVKPYLEEGNGCGRSGFAVNQGFTVLYLNMLCSNTLVSDEVVFSRTSK